METSESGAGVNGQRSDGGAGSGTAALTVGRHVDRVTDNAQEAWSRTRETVNDLKERLDLDGRIERNPYGMVAAALGIGYVLGGGFFSPLTARIVRLGMKMGLRLAAIPFIENELRGLADNVFNGEQAEGAEAETPGGGKGRKSQSSKGNTKGR
jgi:hypothetical protein